MNPSVLDDLGKFILRLTLGVLTLFHGFAKIMHGVDPIAGMLQGVGLPAVLAYGVYLGEVLGPVLLILGLYARIGAALIFINMLFAIFLAHMGDIFALTQHGGWALELQAFYLFVALGLMFTGPGRLGLQPR